MRLFEIVLLLLLSIVALFAEESFFNHVAMGGHGEPVVMSTYQNASLLLVVNVASNCGFTYSNYKDLKNLHKKYHQHGLQILAFPCNQFGEQEPGTDQEIQTFVSNYGVQFPVFAKIDVNGRTAHPIYKFLKSNFEDESEIGWNFVKWLVVDGLPVKRIASRVKPRQMEEDIKHYLGLDAPAQEL